MEERAFSAISGIASFSSVGVEVQTRFVDLPRLLVIDAASSSNSVSFDPENI